MAISNEPYDNERNKFVESSVSGQPAVVVSDPDGSDVGGGIYNSTPPTLADGQHSDAQLDVNGNTKVTQATQLAGEDLANNVQLTSSKSHVLLYQAAAAADVVVATGLTYLEGVIFGANNGSAQVTICDHATSGSTNIKIQMNGDTLLTSCGGFLKINSWFTAGVTITAVNQTQMTFIGHQGG